MFLSVYNSELPRKNKGSFFTFKYVTFHLLNRKINYQSTEVTSWCRFLIKLNNYSGAVFLYPGDNGSFQFSDL